jgi:aminomethyltransferase
MIFADDRQVGEVTSGTFSPTLQISLAMAFVDPAVSVAGTVLSIDVRGRREPAQVVKLPFYKRRRTTSNKRTG